MATVKILLTLDVIPQSYDRDNTHHSVSPECVAERVRAGLYQTYVNPERNDAGIRSIRSVEIVK